MPEPTIVLLIVRAYVGLLSSDINRNTVNLQTRERLLNIGVLLLGGRSPTLSPLVLSGWVNKKIEQVKN